GAVAAQVSAAPGASELGFPARYFAIKLIEGDQATCALPALRSVAAGLGPLRDRLAARTGMSADTLMADTRYGMIAGACREVISISASSRRQLSDRLDKVMTSPVFGLPIFLGIMFVVFAFTFVCGEPLCRLVEMVFGGLGVGVSRIWPSGCLPWLRELVIGGVIPGVGGVLTFLPNILLLFLAIAFLEGTGYMNRAAFVMDGFMHRFGLHGKSFIPMLLGFGCTVPAIMATRTIESRRDRLTTILILPLVSCGARFPIYALFIPAFFAARYRALVLWLIYVIGLAFALLFARLLKSTLFRGEEEVFVMELPPYRMPTAKGIAIDLGERAVMYLHKAGTVILAASVILFLVNSYPKTAGLSAEESARLRELEQAVASQPGNQEALRQRDELMAARTVAQARSTLGGRIGGALSRALVFAGFENRRGDPDWKASSAIIGAFAAKELFVSQLTILYAQDRPRYLEAARQDVGEGEDGWMRAALADNYTPLSGFCMMLFCLIAMPCIGTVAVVWRETGSLRLTLAQLAGLTLTAYATATIVYQLGKLLSLGTA
ncbi:MAG: ferrous iron transport protein B, partial [Oligosphaeraceae bacterium]